MPSSNDRKISQLPLLTEIKEDTTFLVVSDVGTTPKNERMFAKTFFQQIPLLYQSDKNLMVEM